MTILGGVQESFLKVRQSIPEAVKIVQQADEHLDYWMKTWSDWAQLQEGATAKYMSTSFAMQLHVGRFCKCSPALPMLEIPLIVDLAIQTSAHSV